MHDSLRQSMRRLVCDMRMLTGLTVIYGNRHDSASCSVGLAREIAPAERGFVPAPKAIDAHSLYDLASLTKLFTCISVLQLVEQGKLAMDSLIGEVDKRFVHLRGVTLYDALTYRAVLKSPERIDRQPDARAAERQVFAMYSAPDMPDRLYSDMNALLLKYVVESVSGWCFDEYIRQHICQPAGMGETFARVPDDRLSDCLDYNYEHHIIDGAYILLDDRHPGLPHDPKARLLSAAGGGAPCGHAGLFSTAGDMARFAQALLGGELLSRHSVLEIGVNRTGIHEKGRYRQYLGYLCFAKSPVQRLSELPSWMDHRSFGISGYTGNHIAIDPEADVFDIFLGNRCHNRVSKIVPEEDIAKTGLATTGEGQVVWPDGRQVPSSCLYIFRKDAMLHRPVYDCLIDNGWMKGA